MAYPEKLLADDEKVVEHLHPHWITLVPATLWFMVICAAGGFGDRLRARHGTDAHSLLVIIIVVVGLVLLSWLSSGRGSAGDHALRLHHPPRADPAGMLHHTGRDIALQRITDVGFTQTLWDRIVGAGTLTIESAGEHGQEALTTSRARTRCSRCSTG